jgi:hypothetical protein
MRAKSTWWDLRRMHAWQADVVTAGRVFHVAVSKNRNNRRNYSDHKVTAAAWSLVDRSMVAMREARRRGLYNDGGDK